MRKQNNNLNGRLLGIFFLGFLLLNYPIFSLVNKDRLLFGLPLLYIYIFVVWGFLIAFVYWVIRRNLETAAGSVAGNDRDA